MVGQNVSYDTQDYGKKLSIAVQRKIQQDQFDEDNFYY